MVRGHSNRSVLVSFKLIMGTDETLGKHLQYLLYKIVSKFWQVDLTKLFLKLLPLRPPSPPLPSPPPTPNRFSSRVDISMIFMWPLKYLISFKKISKHGFMAIKLDLEKVYDNRE